MFIYSANFIGNTCFMVKQILVSFGLSMLFQTGYTQKKEAVNTLKKEIVNKLALPRAHFGVAFKDLQTGTVLVLNEKDAFHAASTMKTPVLMELFRQAAGRKIFHGRSCCHQKHLQQYCGWQRLLTRFFRRQRTGIV